MSDHQWSEAEIAHTPVTWSRTDNTDFPYQARIGASRWALRLNDFPLEPLFTLFIDDKEIAHLDDWPAHWTRWADPETPEKAVSQP